MCKFTQIRIKIEEFISWSLLTHVLPVSEFQKGFELFADKNSGACKVVLTME